MLPTSSVKVSPSSPVSPSNGYCGAIAWRPWTWHCPFDFHSTIVLVAGRNHAVSMRFLFVSLLPLRRVPSEHLRERQGSHPSSQPELSLASRDKSRPARCRRLQCRSGCVSLPAAREKISLPYTGRNIAPSSVCRGPIVVTRVPDGATAPSSPLSSCQSRRNRLLYG